MEGESLFIRCHSWKNRTTKKVTYYRNGEALKYWYENHDIYIANATVNDNGIYYCTGFVWRINYTSIPLKITVMKGELVEEREVCSRGRKRGRLRGGRSLQDGGPGGTWESLLDSP